MLEYTSTLFATVPFHAYYKHNTQYHHIFLLVTVLSILFHTTNSAEIKKLDTIAAHLAYLFMLWETFNAIMYVQNGVWLALFPLSVLGLWGAEFKFPDHREELHIALHITSVVGLHLFLVKLYPASACG